MCIIYEASPVSMHQCWLMTLLALFTPSSAGHLAPVGRVAQCITNTSLPAYLPRSVVPSHYSLLLDLPAPNPNGTQGYNGTVRILTTVQVETSCVMLHAKEMEVHAATASISSGTMAARSIVLDQQSEMLRLDFDRPLAAGAHTTLVLHFHSSVHTISVTIRPVY